MKHCIIFTKHYRPQDNTWLACAAHGYILYWASNSCHEVIHQETCLSGIRRENSGKGVVVACGTFSLEQSLYNPERVLGQFHNILFRTRSFGSWGGFSAPNNFGKKISIGHVRYISIQAWLRGFLVKIVNFPSFLCPSIPKRDFDTKKTTPNVEVWPESLGAMLEYWYIVAYWKITVLLLS